MKSHIAKALEQVKAELDHIQKKVASLLAERERITGLAVSFEERCAALYEEIDLHAEAGRKRFFDLANVAEISKNNLDTLPGALGRIQASPYDFIEFLCCAFNRELKENLTKELKALWPSDAIGNAYRKQKLEQIATELRQLEQAEEAISVELEGLGVEVERRADLSPEIFLEVKES